MTQKWHHSGIIVKKKMEREKKYLNLIVEMKHHLRTRLGDLVYTIRQILLNSIRTIPAPSVKIPEPSACTQIHKCLEQN